MKRLLEEFRKLPDYRKNKVAYTNPSEILFLSLLAVMSGANSFENKGSGENDNLSTFQLN